MNCELPDRRPLVAQHQHANIGRTPVSSEGQTVTRMDMAQNLELAVHTFPGECPVLLIHGFTRSAVRIAVRISVHDPPRVPRK
jgi:hypothetical protein